MDVLVQQLGGLLLKAVPTIILLAFVHLYLKFMFFRPLSGVLAKRREATAGALDMARKALEVAAEKATVYDIALKEARAEMYREQEATRRAWLEQQTTRIDQVREQTHAALQDAGHQIESEMAAARTDLASRSQMLALQIAETLSARRSS